MTKDEVLSAVRALASQELTKDELLQAYAQGAPAGVSAVTESPKRFDLAHIMYYIGGAIVFIGIAIFIGQNWETLGFAPKLAATLGAGLVAYLIGVIVGREERLQGMSAAFYLISGLCMPVGFYVLLEHSGAMISLGTIALVSGGLFVLYAGSFALLRQTVLAVFAIIFGSWFFYALTSYMVSGNTFIYEWKFTEYRMLMVGLVYLLLGYGVISTRHAALSGPLYAFGAMGFLGAALWLGGWTPEQNILWELVYPLLVFGALYISVHLRSRALLVFGTMFLMAYIFKITAEYFTEGLGWPLALVFAGLLMIGAGYLSVTLNRKYIKQS